MTDPTRSSLEQCTLKSMSAECDISTAHLLQSSLVKVVELSSSPCRLKDLDSVRLFSLHIANLLRYLRNTPSTRAFDTTLGIYYLPPLSEWISDAESWLLLSDKVCAATLLAYLNGQLNNVLNYAVCTESEFTSMCLLDKANRMIRSTLTASCFGGDRIGKTILVMHTVHTTYMSSTDEFLQLSIEKDAEPKTYDSNISESLVDEANRDSCSAAIRKKSNVVVVRSPGNDVLEAPESQYLSLILDSLDPIFL